MLISACCLFCSVMSHAGKKRPADSSPPGPERVAKEVALKPASAVDQSRSFMSPLPLPSLAIPAPVATSSADAKVAKKPVKITPASFWSQVDAAQIDELTNALMQPKSREHFYTVSQEMPFFKWFTSFLSCESDAWASVAPRRHEGSNFAKSIITAASPISPAIALVSASPMLRVLYDQNAEEMLQNLGIKPQSDKLSAALYLMQIMANVASDAAAFYHMKARAYARGFEMAAQYIPSGIVEFHELLKNPAHRRLAALDGLQGFVSKPTPVVSTTAAAPSASASAPAPTDNSLPISCSVSSSPPIVSRPLPIVSSPFSVLPQPPPPPALCAVAK